ncbi:hypothetical protein D6D21_09576 [Aureobasidium pullulans]|uniref:Velvet domain-containing protein n=1 Tax=Aureobasidium pullulans TaxID=5580 RepID=A0AB74IJZ6_AURPU|nr:hypothetical protein D6D21_09576 [Aureobasidium pullulans]
MADVARRTYARNDHGPRSVESRRSSTRNDYPSPTSIRSREPTSPYSLTITAAPSSSISPSTPFTTRILISSRTRTRTPLLAVCSLVTESHSPLPAGYLHAAKLMDSVQEPTRADLAAVSRERRGDVVGAAGFEGLCVREQGSFRVRVTLAVMTGDVYEAVAEVDSAVFRVGGGRGGVNGVKY